MTIPHAPSAIAVAAIAALALLVPRPVAADDCPPSMETVAGHCCWPGQDWGATTHRCVGSPTCPAPLTPAGEDCVATCDPGMVSVAGQCCWPGQDLGVASARCVGDPICPDGLVARDGQCHPMLRSTAPAGFAGSLTADCEARASSLPGHPGERYLVTCPSGCAGGALWGSINYTDDSTLCAAAVHAGVVAPALGGTFVLTILPGRPAYQGSTRHGVTSSDWGSWARSFAVSAPRP